MATKKIVINKANISRRVFWQNIKTLHVIKRLYKAKYIRVQYLIPYGGTEECNEYNLWGAEIELKSRIQEQKVNKRKFPEVGEKCQEENCNGTLIEGEKIGNGCACHINAPCSYCCQNAVKCDTCDYEENEYC